MGRLVSKTAIVTGATSGMGRAIACLFAREGAAIVCGGRNAERGEAVVAEMPEKASAMPAGMRVPFASRVSRRSMTTRLGLSSVKKVFFVGAEVSSVTRTPPSPLAMLTLFSVVPGAAKLIAGSTATAAATRAFRSIPLVKTFLIMDFATEAAA